MKIKRGIWIKFREIIYVIIKKKKKTQIRFEIDKIYFHFSLPRGMVEVEDK